MKSVDKLVLLPFERYEQLIKNKEKASNKDNFIISKTDTEEKTVSPQKTPPKDIPQKTPPKEIIKEDNNTPKERKPTPIIKVPPRPPGIPNKPRKNRLKWEKLF